MSKLTKKVSIAVVSMATVVTLSGAGALIPVAYGATIAELQAQIAALLAQINALQVQLSAAQGTGAVPAALLSSGDLTLGSKGAAVKALQQYLNANGYPIAASGAGSAGYETEYFGSLTKAALAKFQAAKGISPAAGYFGSITRAKLSSLSAAGAATGAAAGAAAGAATVVVTPAGTGLTVTAAPSQPTPSLAPGDASRIPFTKVNLTASADGDITVTGMTAERVGLAEDASLASVVLLDDQGNQLGLKKTLNSDHRAVIGESMTIKAGTTKTVIVAANRAAVGGSYAGQTVALNVVAVSTSATINAAFPITGTTHTINETLTIGSVTLARGPLDPGASQTKEIGTAGYTFSSIKVTAGSAEKIYLKSIRWNQTGSAGSADLENVKTYVDGDAYATTLSSDGKYYTSNFGDGILIDKGFSKEVAVKGDIKGGSSRTIDFDVAKRTDLYAVGQTYGYGLIPPQTGTTDPTDDTAAFSNTEDPWYDAAQVTVSSGTITISSWTSVAAQNVAINLADQPLGGWVVDVKGEPISVANMKFDVCITESSGTATSYADLDSVKIVDETGKTLAGPIDGSGTSRCGAGVLTFTDTITFPVGVTNIKLLSKLATNFANNDTIQASTTPSTQWTTVTGQTTGVTITAAPTSAVSSQTMTVKAAALTISVSPVPIAQTVIAGTNKFEFARYILDTASSGEDIRLTSLPIEYNVGTGGSATDLTNCYLYDGDTAITTSNSTGANPSAAASSTSFTFTGTGLTLAKGTSKTLSLKCDIKATAAGRYAWGYDSSASPSPTGLTSGQSVSPTENDSAGQIMVATSAGTLSVALDSSSPSYAIVAPGQNVVLAKIKYSAVNEDIDLKQVALQLTDVASNTKENLVNNKVTLWDGTTQVGEAVFSSTDFATSSAISVGMFRIPKDGAKVLTVKGTIAGISVSGPLTKSGDLLKVDYDGDNEGLNGNYGTGAGSGSTITPAVNDTASNGVRIMKAYPSLEHIALSTSDKTLSTDGTYTVYKFKITANQGDIALAKLTFTVASSSRVATTSDFALYAFADSGMSTPDSNFNDSDNPGGLLNGSSKCFMQWVEIYPTTGDCNSGTTTLVIPSGESRWFKLTASVTGIPAAGTTESFRVQLDGDSAFPTVVPGHGGDSGSMGQALGNGIGFGGLALSSKGINNDANNDFIWSPISTTTSNTLYDFDYTNGYGVSGLPSTNMTVETLSK